MDGQQHHQQRGGEGEAGARWAGCRRCAASAPGVGDAAGAPATRRGSARHATATARRRGGSTGRGARRPAAGRGIARRRHGIGVASTIARTCSTGPRPAPATGMQPVRDGLRQDGLHVVGRHVVAAGHQRARLAPRAAPRCRRAGDRPSTNQRARARGGDQRLQVVEQRVRRRAPPAPPAAPPAARPGRITGCRLHRGVAPVAAGEQRALGGAVGVAERDAHQEAVELALGQRVGAELVARVLRGDDEEGPRQRRASRSRP